MGLALPPTPSDPSQPVPKGGRGPGSGCSDSLPLPLPLTRADRAACEGLCPVSRSGRISSRAAPRPANTGGGPDKGATAIRLSALPRHSPRATPTHATPRHASPQLKRWSGREALVDMPRGRAGGRAGQGRCGLFPSLALQPRHAAPRRASPPMLCEPVSSHPLSRGPLIMPALFQLPVSLTATASSSLHVKVEPLNAKADDTIKKILWRRY